MLSQFIAFKDAEPRHLEDISMGEWLTVAGPVALVIVMLALASFLPSKRASNKQEERPQEK